MLRFFKDLNKAKIDKTYAKQFYMDHKVGAIIWIILLLITIPIKLIVHCFGAEKTAEIVCKIIKLKGEDEDS